MPNVLYPDLTIRVAVRILATKSDSTPLELWSGLARNRFDSMLSC